MSLFKLKYDTDPEFKEKHLKYIKEKINCECGKKLSRSNLSSHRKSKLHMSTVNNKNVHEEEINEITKKYIEALEMITKNVIKAKTIN